MSTSSYITLFFTDIEGSTRLAQHLGARYSEVLHKHHKIIRSHLKLNKGREVDNPGDGFFLVFTDPVKALKAAVDMQKDLTTQFWPKDYALMTISRPYWLHSVMIRLAYRKNPS